MNFTCRGWHQLGQTKYVKNAPESPSLNREDNQLCCRMGCNPYHSRNRTDNCMTSPRRAKKAKKPGGHRVNTNGYMTTKIARENFAPWIDRQTSNPKVFQMTTIGILAVPTLNRFLKRQKTEGTWEVNIEIANLILEE